MGAVNATRTVPITRRYLKEHAIWVGMRQRCGKPNCRAFRYYGGRGIRVCRRWSGAGGFARFLADVGPQPFRRAGLHRADNDGPYAPGNVAWADARTQARCMSSNRVLEHDGRRQVLAEWAEDLGVKPGTLGARLARGGPVAKALPTPVAPRRPFSPWAGRRR